MKKKIFAALSAALLMLGAGTDVGAAETSLSKPFREKYKQILESEKYFEGVCIGDLTGDSREDLLVAHNDFGNFDLYVPVGKKLVKKEFSVTSIWGFTQYIKGRREFICMKNYGHTQGAPIPISMEMFAVTDDKTDTYTLFKDYTDKGRGIVRKLNGKDVSEEDFSTALYSLIMATSDADPVPLVRHGEDSLLYYGDDNIIDMDYDEYIKKMLG